MAASQLEMVETALYNRLSGDATLASLAPGGVWNGLADRDANYPVIVFRCRPESRYMMTLGKRREARSLFYDVYTIAANVGGIPQLRIDERIDEVLGDSVLSISPYTNTMIRRRSDIRLREVDSGVEFEYVGGVYEIFVS